MNRPLDPDEPGESKTLNVRFSAKLLAQIEDCAERYDCDKADVVREAVTIYMETHGRKEKRK